MSRSRGGIIILDFKYRVGDLVEVRVPDLLLMSGSLGDDTRLTLPGIILKSNLKYVKFAEDFKWEESFWREFNKRWGNKLMRARVILQAFAVFLIVLLGLFLSR